MCEGVRRRHDSVHRKAASIGSPHEAWVLLRPQVFDSTLAHLPDVIDTGCQAGVHDPSGGTPVHWVAKYP